MSKYDTQLQNYASKISAGYNFDYGIAQTYYVNLKKNMLKTFNKNLSQIFNESVDQFQHITAEEMLNAVTSGANKNNPAILSSSNAKAKALITQVEDVVKDFIGNPKQKTGLSRKNRVDAKTAVFDVVAGINAKRAVNQDMYKNRGPMKAFTEQYKTLVKKTGQEVLKDLEKKLQELPAYQTSTDTKIKAALESYAIRYFAKTLTSKSKNAEVRAFFANMSANSYIKMLQGDMQEEAIENAFNQALADFYQAKNIRDNKLFSDKKIVLKVGDKVNVSGQETPIDLLLNTVFDEKEILDIFNKTYLGEAEIDIDTQINNVLEYKDSSLIFGAQVKSFNVQKGNFMSGLGHRSNLRDLLFSSPQYGSGYSLVGNIAFMGLKTSIIRALGERNVLYVDGGGKYWMDDFIKTFRSRSLYLMLETEKVKDQKNTYRASSAVALYNYMSAISHRGDII